MCPLLPAPALALAAILATSRPAVAVSAPSMPGFADAVERLEVSLEARPGHHATRPWTTRAAGSVRLVGSLLKASADAGAICEVVVDGEPVWSHTFAPHHRVAHGVDIVLHDLGRGATPALRIKAIDRDVRVEARLEVLAEPYLSRWAADLPSGYPTWSEAERVALRDKGQAILQAIRDASARGPRRVVVPPGDYLFHARWSQASTLSDLANLEIVADGATFWFEPPMIHGLLFERCRNLVLRGLTIDFTEPCWFQAEVVRIDRTAGTIEARTMPGYAPRDAEGRPEAGGMRPFMFYDAMGRFIPQLHTPGAWKAGVDPGTVVCHELGGSGIPASLQPGDHLAATIRTGAALRSIECAGMRFVDLKLWSSPGMAVYEGGGPGGHVYDRVRATRRPRTNRLQAFGADIFHLAGTDQGPTLLRCEAAYGADDNLNIHGSFGRVVARVDARRHHLDGAYAAGDSIEFRDPATLDHLGTATVLAATATPDGPTLRINPDHSVKGSVLVTLDKPLDLPPLTLVIMDGKRSAAGFVVRDCWLHDNFQRTLINGSPGGRIENSTLQQVGHGLTVQFETWGPWMEGPFARDLVVRGNRFLGAPTDGPAIRVSMHPPGGGSNARRFASHPVTNLTIAGNFVAHGSATPFVIHNVDGLAIHDNHLDLPRPPAANEWVVLQDCSDVSVRDNQTPRESR